MRKLIMLNRISLDGFFAGPNGEIDWFIHDPEVDEAAHQMMHADTLLFGRLTYDMFFGYWPHVAGDPNASAGDLALAAELSQMTKVVFSRTLKEVTWANSRLSNRDLADEVRELKRGPGAEITIFGSGTLVHQLAGAGLIDGYLIIVTPVIIGTGKPLFRNTGKYDLRLLDARSFGSGNVLLHYETGRQQP